MHNPTGVPVLVAVRLSVLGSAGGQVLPLEAAAVGPEGDVEVDARGSAEVRVLVPPGTPPGHLHALLTSTATPRQALPLPLEVLAEER